MVSAGSSYKQQHEQFVSEHGGTSVQEIAFILFTPPLAVLFRHMAIPWLSTPKQGIGTVLLRDFSLLVLPVMVSMTIMSNQVDALVSGLLSAIICFALASDKLNATGSRYPTTLTHPMAGRRPFVAWFRAYVGIGTAIAILAVDFQMWPRRFCKAETYGTGLMDAGVGSFVIVNGIVAPEATKLTAARITGILSAVKSAVPLCILGAIRVIAVKSTDYHEHVTEYGVHWNFFFTLALVKVFGSGILYICGLRRAWLAAAAAAISHQVVLSGVEFRRFILFGADGQGSRGSFIDANREGIFSSAGYIAIYLAAVTLGQFLWQQRNTVQDWLKAFFVLLAADLILWVLLYLCSANVEQVSRRLANLPYIIWILAYSIQLLVGLLLVDIIATALQHTTLQLKPLDSKKASKVSSFCLLDAVSQQALVYFLLSNVLTGLVNLTTPTIHLGTTAAFTIVSVYMYILSGAVTVLYQTNIKLKCW